MVDHATLSGLDYDSSGHTGFAPSNKIEEGNSSVGVVDTGLGEIRFTVDGTVTSVFAENAYGDVGFTIGNGVSAPVGGAVLELNGGYSSAGMAFPCYHQGTAGTSNNVQWTMGLQTSLYTRSAFQMRASFSNVTDATRKSYVTWGVADGSGWDSDFIAFNGSKLGINDITPSEKLDVGGNIRADRYYEYSSIFVGNALEAITNIKYIPGSEDANGWAEVDHTTLPIGVLEIIKDTKFKDKVTGEIITGRELPIILDENDEGQARDYSQHDKITVDTPCRNLGNQVQVILKAVQELKAENDELKARIEDLENA